MIINDEKTTIYFNRIMRYGGVLCPKNRRHALRRREEQNHGQALALCHHQRKATNDSFLSDYMATHDGKTPRRAVDAPLHG